MENQDFLTIANATASGAVTLIGGASSFAAFNLSLASTPVIPFVLVNNQGFGTYDTANHSIVLAATTSGDPTTGLNFAGNAGTGIPTLTSNATINSIFNTAASAINLGNNLLNLQAGALATTANLTLNGGTLTSIGQVVGATAGTDNTIVLIDRGATLTVNSSINNGVGANTTSTTNALTMIGDPGSVFVLNGTDNFSGTTNVNGASLVLGSSSALAFSTLNWNGGNNASLSFGNLTAASLGGLTGTANTITLTNALSQPVALSVGNNSLSTAATLTITGTGSLIKNGNGVTTLDGGQGSGNTFSGLTYTGTTTVNGGTLSIVNLFQGPATIGQYYTPAGNTLILNGGLYVTGVTGSASSIQAYIPSIVFNGGSISSSDSVPLLGEDINGGLHNIIIEGTTSTSTILAKWNNKNILVMGTLTGGIGTNLNVGNLGGGSGTSGVQFFNADNPFSGTISTTGTTAADVQLSINNVGTVANAFQNAIVNLAAPTPTTTNGVATYTGTTPPFSPTGNGIGGTNALFFNSSIYTSAIIGGLAGQGSFALSNSSTTSSANNAGINLIIDTNNTAAAPYSGRMTGAGSVTIEGTGTVTLSGSQGYGGLTTLVSGVLGDAGNTVFSGTGSLSGASGSIVFAGGTLQLEAGIGATPEDITSKIATSGSNLVYLDSNGQSISWSSGTIGFNVNGLVKLGQGTVAIGSLAFPGTTTIKGGLLQLGGWSGEVDVQSGGELGAPTGGATGLALVHVFNGGGINLENNVVGDTMEFVSGLTLDTGSHLSFDFGANNGSDLLLDDAGITVSNGVIVNLQLASGQVPSSTNVFTLISGVGGINPAQFTVGTVPAGFQVSLTTIDGLELIADVNYSAPFNAYFTGQGSNNNFSTIGNWAQDATGTPASAAPGALSAVTFSATNETQVGSATTIPVVLDQDSSVESLTFQGAQNVTISGAHNLFIFAQTSQTPTGILLASGAGAASITGGTIVLSEPQAWENDSVTSLLTIGSVIKGTQPLTIQGVGTVIFNASNVFTGGITIANGVLQTGNAGALAGGSLTMTGGTLDLHGTALLVGKLGGTAGLITDNSATAASLSVATLNGTAQTFGGNLTNGTASTATVGLNLSGTGGTLTLIGTANSASGIANLNTNVLQIGDGASTTGTIGFIQVNDTAGTLTFAPFGGSINYTGTLNGTGVVQVGAGHVTIGDTASTYTGGTNINAGTLTLGATNVLGNANNVLSIGNGVLDMNGFNVTAGTLTGTGGTVTNAGTGTGIITVNPGTASTETTAAVFLDGTNGKVGITLYSATSSSPGGTLTLSTFNTAGQSNFSGGITVNNGVFAFSNLPDQVLQLTGGTVTMNGGFIFETNTGGNDSGQYFIPEILFNGGGVLAQEGVLHLGEDASSNTFPIVVTAAGATLESTYNNKDLIVDGLVQGTTGTITVGNHNASGFSSGVTFTNPNNTFSGTVFDESGLQATNTTGQAEMIIIANAGTEGTALQFANIILNGNFGGGVGDAMSSYNTVFNPLPSPGNGVFASTDPRFSAMLGFNSSIMTAAIIAGLSGNGNFALENANLVSDPSLTLIVNQSASVDNYTGAMSGSGSLTHSGAGSLVLGGANIFTGSAIVNGGAIVLSSQGALNNALMNTSGAGAFQFASGAGGEFTIGGLTGSGNLALQDNSTANAGIILQVGNTTISSVTYTGALSGPGALQMIGAGAQILSGADNFTGKVTAVSGLLDFSGGVSHTVGAVSIGAGNVQVDTGTNLHSNAVNETSTGGLTILGTQTLAAASGASTSIFDAVPTITNVGKLDIGPEEVIFQSTGATGNEATMISQLQTLVTEGKNGISWTGDGITSSTVAADVAAGTNNSFHTVVAIVNNGALPVTEQFTRFGGQSVNTNSILVTRALAGDANLDNTVNNTDLVALLTHFTLTGQTQATGDFNGDGTVNNTDLVALLTDYGQGLPGGFALSPSDSGGSSVGGGLGSPAGVPEPASLAVLAIGGAALLARRRRKIR